MTYYLRHYFDPDLDDFKPRPKLLENGSVDHRDLGFVRNAVKDEVLAQIEKADEDRLEDYDIRFLLDEKRLPLGPGTRANPDNPDQLLAAVNGYVVYEDGLISVRRLLVVNGDIDFRVGNVVFINDLIVSGVIRRGFTVQARNIQAKDLVEGAWVRAMESISCESGVKANKEGVLEAGRSLKLAFAENALLQAGENVLIEGDCLHTEVFCGRKAAVKGRLIGGSVHAYDMVYVGTRLGGGIGTRTAVELGLDPLLVKRDTELSEQLLQAQEEVVHLERMAAKGSEHRQEYEPQARRAARRMELLNKRRAKLHEELERTKQFKACRLVVPGEVRPGVEIKIGNAYLNVPEYMTDVQFYYQDDAIKAESPALRK